MAEWVFDPLFIFDFPSNERKKQVMAMSKQAIVALIRPWALSACETAGVILWDIEYVREGGENYLRVFIDKEDGIGIEDCEKVSHIMNDILDTEDPIEESYSFQVSSPGIERELRLPHHFERFLGEAVRVRLYKALDGNKEYIGILSAFDDDTLTLTLDEETSITFERASVSKVKVYFEF